MGGKSGYVYELAFSGHCGPDKEEVGFQEDG